MYLADTPFGRAWLPGVPLKAENFRLGTPLHHFFAWNERLWRPDRRYVIANDIHCLLTAFGGGERAREICALHLGLRPLIRARLGSWLLVSRDAEDPGERSGRPRDPAVLAVARRLVENFLAGIGAADPAAHAAVFAAFEELEEKVDLGALARLRQRRAKPSRGSEPRRILVIRLSAFGDFVQSTGPFEAIRRHHESDRITLLTSAPFAEFARELGWFDDVLVDRRPRQVDLRGWLALRRSLRAGGFDRVYDLQTSQRSSAYRRLFAAASPPEWSGIAKGCSHPHANLDRDRQHTIDKQAEQLLMAGIYPTPLPRLPLFCRALPKMPGGRDLVLIAPGCSPHRPAKRWPAARFGAVAQAIEAAGYLPVVVGTGTEKPLASGIRSASPGAVDLVGQTSIASLAALAQRAVLTIGNDNGVSHLAAAADCPVVVLFSQAGSDPALCAPRGRLVRIVCVPDLNELAAETVLAEALASLRQSSASAPPPHPVASWA
jgi:ADP-heptose:LPS heptosyltransferase